VPKTIKFDKTKSMNRTIGKVFDMTHPLVLNIKAQDVANATVGDECACAITQAGLRSVQDVVKMWTYNTIAYIELTSGAIVRGELSKQAQDMRKAFDTDGCFPIGKLTINPPKEKIGHRKGQSQGSSVRTGQANNLLKKPPTRAIAGRALIPAS